MSTDSKKPKKKKTQKHIHSPFRLNAVKRGRLEWNSTGGTWNERLHDFFKYQYEGGGYSSNELVFITNRKFHTKEWDEKIDNIGYIDEEKQTKDLDELNAEDKLALLMAKQGLFSRLTDFRQWLENESLILASNQTEERELFYCNLMEKPSIEEHKTKMKRIAERILETEDRISTIQRQGRSIRQKKADQQSDRFKQRNRRKKKTYDGDFGDE